MSNIQLILDCTKIMRIEQALDMGLLHIAENLAQGKLKLVELAEIYAIAALPEQSHQEWCEMILHEGVLPASDAFSDALLPVLHGKP